MSSSSISCKAGSAGGFLKAFAVENNPNYAVNCAIAMCCCVVLMSVLGVVSGAEFLGNLFAGLSLAGVCYFVILIFLSDKSAQKQDSETLEDFLEEHSYVKEFLE